jgi:hypothetical protein
LRLPLMFAVSVGVTLATVRATEPLTLDAMRHHRREDALLSSSGVEELFIKPALLSSLPSWFLTLIWLASERCYGRPCA